MIITLEELDIDYKKTYRGVIKKLTYTENSYGSWWLHVHVKLENVSPMFEYSIKFMSDGSSRLFLSFLRNLDIKLGLFPDWEDISKQILGKEVFVSLWEKPDGDVNVFSIKSHNPKMPRLRKNRKIKERMIKKWQV